MRYREEKPTARAYTSTRVEEPGFKRADSDILPTRATLGGPQVATAHARTRGPRPLAAQDGWGRGLAGTRRR